MLPEPTNSEGRSFADRLQGLRAGCNADWEWFFQTVFPAAKATLLKHFGLHPAHVPGDNVHSALGSAVRHFLQALQRGKYEELDSVDGLTALFITFAIRRYLNRVEKAARQRPTAGEGNGDPPTLEEAAADFTRPDEVTIRADFDRWFRQTLDEFEDSLAPLEKTIFQLRFRSDPLPANPEIARQAGCSLATVGRYVHNLKERLQEWLRNSFTNEGLSPFDL